MADVPKNPLPEDPELDAWLAQLAGRAAGAPEDAAAHQARLIRNVLLNRQERAEQAITDEEIRRGWDKLQFRLKRERLLESGGGLGAKPQWFAMAASVAVVAMGVLVVVSNLREVQPAPEVLWSAGELDSLRGEELAPQSVITPTPDVDARALAGQLAAATIPFELSGVPDEPRRLLKIQVAGQTIPDEVAAALARAGIDTSDRDVVYVEFASGR